MFNVSTALLLSSATVNVRIGGGIWLKRFAMELVNVCSAVTSEPLLRGCVFC